MKTSFLVPVRPFGSGEFRGVTRHQQGQTTNKTVISSTKIAVLIGSTLSSENYAYRLDYKHEQSMGHISHNDNMTLNAVSARKALAIMNAILAKGIFSQVTLAKTVIIRTCKSSTIAQRMGHGSGYPSTCNPSNSDAPFGDPHRQN